MTPKEFDQRIAAGHDPALMADEIRQALVERELYRKILEDILSECTIGAWRSTAERIKEAIEVKEW